MKHIVVPRSGSSMTRAQKTTKTGSSGRKTWLARDNVPRCCLRASRSAPQTKMASLPNSDGWNCNGPKSIHRRAP